MAGSARFDVRAFARTASGTHRDRMDLDAIATEEIPADAIRALRILRDLEAATMAHLRNVLVTSTHKDARVTAFLVTWAFEKFWIADALTAILEVRAVPPAAAAPERLAGPGPVRRSISAFVDGPSIVAVHMTSGLVDDWILGAAYRRSLEGAPAPAPALADAVADILVVKARHSQFFEEEAVRRLLADQKAVRLTRRGLRRDDQPVGAGNLAEEDRAFFSRFVFAGGSGRLELEDVVLRVAELPGIDDGTVETLRRRLTA